MKNLADAPPTVNELFGNLKPKIRRDTLEELDKIIENSSEKNRNFFMAYIGLLVYVQAIVFSTTDLKLLLDTEGLKLPIIDLTLPLVGFYVVVPVFIIALHFNFLQNLESHYYKLMRWKDAHPAEIVPRSRIQAFLFDYALLETGSQMERWVRWSNSLLVLNLAPITLGLILWRYSDRQDGWVSVWHLISFAIDNYLVWKFRLAIEHEQSPRIPLVNRKNWLEFHKYGLRGWFGFFLVFETLLTTGTAWLPSEIFIDTILGFAYKTENLELDSTNWLLNLTRNKSISLPNWFENYLNTFKHTNNSRLASLILPRIEIEPKEVIWKPDRSILESEAKLSGESDWVKYFYSQGDGFRPSTLNLRMAHLSEQNLPRANLESAQLEGVDLSGAKLYSANLKFARIQSGNLDRAQLQEANLNSAQLQGAKLWGSNMQGSTAYLANFMCADLGSHPTTLSGMPIIPSSCKFQGANLLGANFQGANLSGVHFEGSNFFGTKFENANLNRVNFSGSIFTGASFSIKETDPEYFSNIKRPSIAEKFNAHGLAFTGSKPDWVEMQNWSNVLPDGGSCKDALALKNDEPSDLPPRGFEVDNHQIIYTKIIPEICSLKDTKRSRLAVIRGIRRNYGQNVSLSQSGEPVEIDNVLCTDDKCSTLKTDIDGLKCDHSGMQRYLSKNSTLFVKNHIRVNKSLEKKHR
jgi:uncharacterized protein YjbI with pentapeptide repeats